MYALAMTIDHYYWEQDCKCYCVRQVEKKAIESHSQKQGKASTSSTATALQNKANLSPAASSTKNFSSKLSLSSAPKKQPNTLQVDLSSKLANNGKLTSDKHKYLENNLCLYCSAEDHKLDFCPKSHSASVTANTPAATFEKPLEKQRVIPKTPHRLRAALNFSVQQ